MLYIKGSEIVIKNNNNHNNKNKELKKIIIKTKWYKNWFKKNLKQLRIENDYT